ncbi:hypothetical protein FACS189491_05660 [Spirochaetia bacterium]|nr:hypothetical protein FACS189491_05660 [Spirochaetia bacterium]
MSQADWELKPYFVDEKTEEWYYVAEIRQTNNPRLYQIYLKTDSLGWDNYKYHRGIFNIDKDTFMEEIYLFDGYRPGIFIVPDPRSGGAGGYRFPHEGVYSY